MSDLTRSIARTLIPYLVGLAVTLALRAGIDLHGYTPEITVAIGTVYYTAVRLAEKKIPALGRLLGATGSPAYPKK